MILDFYLMRQMARQFFFGLGLFTVLFFSVDMVAGVARAMVENEASAGLLALYVVYRLPWILVITAPMAVLLACLLAYGELSTQGEYTALRTVGVGFLRVARPGTLFALLVALVTMTLNDRLVPISLRAANEARTALVAGRNSLARNVSHSIVKPGGREQIIYVNEIDPRAREARNMLVLFFEKRRLVREIYAATALWSDQAWQLADVRDSLYDREGRLVQVTSAARARLPADAADLGLQPQQLASHDLTPDEMRLAELAERISRDSGASPAEKARLQILYHHKLALPAACFVFSLLAIPLAIRPHKSTTSVGMGLSLLLILAYYILMTTGITLGEKGILLPVVAAWMPDVVFLLLGAYLSWEASRR